MSASGKVVPARPASVVVLARSSGNEFEVFMVRRHVRSEFVPDAFVFPGGSVKEADVATETVPNLSAPVVWYRSHRAWVADFGWRRYVSASRRPVCCWPTRRNLLAAPEREERLAGYRDDLNQHRLSLIQTSPRRKG